ncbi:MAG: DUF11 domain-containing protein [Goleter apudmare HA4340-LM2]|jgi:uncharacterized repeat protein (TIGR01451 family)|nr:DUF11 domain-containing protein [Goleter apudmare HA4340-LM2]
MTPSKITGKYRYIKIFTTGTALILSILASNIQSVQAEGSRDLYPASSPIGARRANLEWRNEDVAGLIKRRTLLKVYANAGEYILLGSSSIGVGGNIYVYNPGLVTGLVGSESFPPSPSWNCATDLAGTGSISSRTQELAGPKSIDGSGNTTGYTPCYYLAPTSGVYDVVIFGPNGFTSTGNPSPQVSATINLTGANDFTNNQRNNATAWDVTVRTSTSSTTDITGRLFAYYLALFTGGNNRPIYPTVYPVTIDGYRYQTILRGLDPNGFLLYGNEVGFFDSDGTTTLYHNIVGTNGDIASPQGGTKLGRPQFPVFFNPPDIIVLGSVNRYDRFGGFLGVGITTNPIPPAVSNPNFTGSLTANNSKVGNGGTFSFSSTVPGIYEIVIKGKDSTDFSPTNPKNRVLMGYINSAGTQTQTWDGKDNAGNFFPIGNNYSFVIRIRAGEYHFPMLDAENNFFGGPTVTLLNPPSGYPTDLLGFSPTTGFYDDRVYKTKNGAIVHTGATQADIDNNEPLCGINPPTIRFSDSIIGFDTSTNQRAFGQNGDLGNANTPCDGSFGDTKGLDQWTFFPSGGGYNVLNIVSPDLTISKTHAPTDFVKGGTGTYIIVVPNSGSDATNGTQVTVTDTLPTGIIPTAAVGNGWNCTIAGQTVTCTRSDVLAANNSYPNINISVSINSGITATSVTNTATVSGGGDGDDTNNTSPPDVVNILNPNAPKLLLIKRITRINNQDLTDIVDGSSAVSPTAANYVAAPRDVDDNDPKWAANYLRGLINAGAIKPSDEIEYTIYFLSAGSTNVSNVKFCDLVPANVTFLPTAFNSLSPNDGGLATADQGIAMAVGATTPTVYFSNAADSDRATFHPANDPNTPSYCPTNTNGAIAVEITRTPVFPFLPPATSPGTPANSYGFVRFRGKVK